MRESLYCQIFLICRDERLFIEVCLKPIRPLEEMKMDANQQIFQDTMHRIQNDPRLIAATRQLVENTRVYPKGFISKQPVPSYDTRIWFEENLTLPAARKLAAEGYRPCVLNFADAVFPGGYVEYGGYAQEEYLCKSSNLFPSLKSENAKMYYDIHREILRENGKYDVFLSTDTAIYSPGVTVFKCDFGYVSDVYLSCVQVYTDDWFVIDVITCAAPKFSDHGPTIRQGDLKYLFENRISNIFEIALDNQADTLVLGAYGCGAFYNPPEVAASAFRTCLENERYSHAFRNVVFAVPGSRERSENRRVFEDVFGTKQEEE